MVRGGSGYRIQTYRPCEPRSRSLCSNSDGSAGCFPKHRPPHRSFCIHSRITEVDRSRVALGISLLSREPGFGRHGTDTLKVGTGPRYGHLRPGDLLSILSSTARPRTVVGCMPASSSPRVDKYDTVPSFHIPLHSPAAPRDPGISNVREKVPARPLTTSRDPMGKYARGIYFRLGNLSGVDHYIAERALVPNRSACGLVLRSCLYTLRISHFFRIPFKSTAHGAARGP